MMAMGIHRARSAAKSRSQATRCGTSGAPSQRKTQTILPRPNEVMAGSRQNSPTSPQWASFVQGAIKDSEWKLPASSSFKAAFQYIQAIYLSDFKSIFISIFKSFVAKAPKSPFGSGASKVCMTWSCSAALSEVAVPVAVVAVVALTPSKSSRRKYNTSWRRNEILEIFLKFNY